MYGIAANMQPKKEVAVLISILLGGLNILNISIIGSWSSQSTSHHYIHKYFQ